MYKLCSTEQTVRRQKELALLFLEELQKKTYEEISVSDFCRNANIPRKTFYRYFSDKEGALYALIDLYLLSSEKFVLTDHSPNPFSRNKIVLMLHYCQRYPNLFYAINSNKLWDELISRMFEFVSRRLTDNAYFSRKEDSYGPYFLLGGIISLLHRWCENKFKDDPELIADSIIRNIEAFCLGGSSCFIPDIPATVPYETTPANRS